MVRIQYGSLKIELICGTKLVVVGRSDLPFGLRAVQATHAAIGFTFEHPQRAGPWYYNSNYLIQKEIENEEKLISLIENCKRNELAITVFREPDLKDQITAIAIEPSKITQKLVSRLPLMFQNVKS